MITGLYTALVTPFTANGDIDEQALLKLIDHQIQGGVDGILVLGTTGESPTLTHEEKKRIITLAKSRVAKRVPLMVGCGSYATKTTVEAAIEAESLGADSLLVVVPYYNKPTQNGLLAHFKAVAEATHLPIVVYNIAGRTGVNLETATLEKIAALPNIVAVKEASGNILQMNDVIDRMHEKRKDFTVLSGDDSLTLPLVALGGSGVISVISNLLPKTTKALLKHALDGNFAEARKYNKMMRPLVQTAFIETNPAPIKYMLELAGISKSYLRLPLVELSDANKTKVRDALKAASFINEEVSIS